MSLLLSWIFLLAVAGGVVLGPPGALLGIVFGWLLGTMVSNRERDKLEKYLQRELQPLTERINELELKLVRLANQLNRAGSTDKPQQADKPVTQEASARKTAAPPEQAAETGHVAASQPSHRQVDVEISPARTADVAARSAYSRTVTVENPVFIQKIFAFFTGGNLVVRVGVVVLFFGVAFLLRYAAERNLVPIELRLSGVVLAAIAVLVIGWRLRERPGHYGLVLQGGAIGVLYLTVYSAAKLYGLLPMGLAFAMMAAIVAFSALLAVLQNARALALFGSAGGFLAPVLVSTGSGSHVALFSYYALLNAGILAIAWHRSWRELNLLGFVFTFVIGSAWGYLAYRSEHFLTTEPFLILFFLMYVLVSVLFATRQPPQLRGYVDGSLMFGVPIVAFALQAALVRNFEYAMAISALLVAAFYIALASLLWRRNGTNFRMLIEAFLALGVVFASLAIPLALDGRWTAAAWAMEGAALLWVGVRQSRVPAQIFAVLLQLAAGAAFMSALNTPVAGLPVWNGIWLGSAVVSVSALFSSWWLYRHPDSLLRQAGVVSTLLLVWGLLWWFGAGMREIEAHLQLVNQAHATLLFISVTAMLLDRLGHKLQWPPVLVATLVFLPMLVLILLGEFMLLPLKHAFQGWGLLVWSVAITVHLRVLWSAATVWPEPVARLWHPLGLWLFLALFSWELDWAIAMATSQSMTWRWIAWAILPGAVLYLLLHFRQKLPWPLADYKQEYLGLGLGVLAVYLTLWGTAAASVAGNSAPLPYVPLLNPLDIAQCFALLAALRWVLWWRVTDVDEQRLQWVPLALVVVAAGLFVWLNTVLARAVHFWGGVSWNLHAMQHSVVFQTAIAILWTLTAMAAMVVARKQASRRIWFAGAGLLAIVVLKLFFVDLAGAGTLERIISFLMVGGLMLVIGFYSPLPPHTETEKAS